MPQNADGIGDYGAKPKDVVSIQRVLAAYKSTLHVSGAPDRVVSNDATVRMAVDVLNRATR